MTSFSSGRIIRLLVGLSLVGSVSTFPASCCSLPVTGTGGDNCVSHCTRKCLSAEYIVRRQSNFDKNNALEFAQKLEHASRIILEDNSGTANFDSLESLELDASNVKFFPEPLIRIRDTEVTENSFTNLKTITITPINPYCEKGTIFDIDKMKEEPRKILKNLEKKVLADCPSNKSIIDFSSPLVFIISHVVVSSCWALLVALYCLLTRKKKKECSTSSSQSSTSKPTSKEPVAAAPGENYVFLYK
ncbi:unnamed protein product [Caenorhabditis auriculariae]|uniref:Receptor L-domain domain-containing protein n=1 Tax=Caenorhabditis auriculariae TaxID=2777116 RepID=A0A8S1H572_9PELO|nr:unnamed protein product [Caenorhabditis auriculariae]